MANNTRTISTRLSIEGEAEYRKAVKAINAELSNLEAELKKTSLEYEGNANSMEALRAKSEALTKVHELQQAKVEELRKVLDAAKRAQAEYAEQTDAARAALEANKTSLSQLDDATRKAGQQWASYSNEIKAAEAQLKVLRSSSEDTSEQEAQLARQIEAAKASMEELDESTGGAASQAGKLIQEQSRLQRNLEAASAVQERATNAVNRYQGQLTSAETAEIRTNREIQRTAQYLDEAAKSADGCATSIDRFGRESKDAAQEGTSAVEALSQALIAAGIQQAVEKTIDVLLACVEAAETFETAMAKVGTIADPTAASLDSIREAVLALSTDTGQAAADLAEATYEAISAGVDTASAVQFVAQANQLAVAGFTDSATAVDVLSTALNAYGLAVDQAGQISDYLITTQNLGKVTVDQLAQSIGKVIPLAAAYGMELSNLSTAYAVLTANGIRYDDATTRLSSMLNELGDSGSEVSKILQANGGTFAELTAQGKSLGDVIQLLGDYVDGDTTAFNALWSSQEAGLAAMSLLQSGADRYNGVLAQMEDSAGATAEAYETMADTGAMAAARLEQSFNNLQIAVGDALAPTMEKLYNAGADAFDWMTQVVTDYPEVADAIASIVVGLESFIVVVTTASIVVAGLKAATSVLGAEMLIFTAAFSGLAALGTFVAMLNDTTTAEEQMLEKTKELRDEIKTFSDDYSTAMGSIDDGETHTLGMVTALQRLVDDLGKAEKGSELYATKLASVQQYVNELNSALPGLNLLYDEQSNSLSRTTESLEEYIRLQVNQERYTEAIEAETDALHLLEEAQEQLEAATIASNEAQQSLNEGYEQSKAGDLSADISTLEYNLVQANEAQAEAKAAVEEAQAAYNSAQTDVEAYATATESAATALDEATTSAQAQAEAQAALTEAYAKAYESAKSNISGQFELWDDLAEKADVSSEDIRKGIEAQISYWQNYTSSLQNLTSRNISGLDNLVAAIDDGSAEAGSALSSLASLSDEELQTIANKYGDLTTAQDTAATESAKNSTAVAQTVEEMSDASVKALDDLVAKFVSSGEDSGSGFTQGLKNGGRYAPEVAEDMASDSASEANMRSAFYSAGQNDGAGLVSGLRSKISSATQAGADLARAALSGYKKESDQHSPSKEWQKAALFDVQGLIQEYQEETPVVSKTAAALAQASLSGYQDSMEQGQRMLAATSLHMAELYSTPARAASSSDLSGLASALERLVSTLSTQGSGDIVIQMNSEEVFRVMRQENESFIKRTGRSAFA